MGFFIFLIILSSLIFVICFIKFDNISEVIEYIKLRLFKESIVVNYDIQIGDLFVDKEILIEPDNPFKTNDITDECNYNKIHIVKDIKYNHKNKLWVKYTSLHNLKCNFEITYDLPAFDFLILFEKRNDLKELFNL